jgi:membrane protein required for colicin V production
MTIDIIFLILLVMAIFKGVQRGLIVAIFSLLALMAGLAAAIKLSAAAADYLRQNTHVPSKWLPVLAFLLVFIAVILLVRWAASLIKAAVGFALLGWADKLGGAILYASIYITIYSVLLFYATNLHVISPKAIASSITYTFIEPWGPIVINSIGKVIPFFKNMFSDLENFFAHLA